MAFIAAAIIGGGLSTIGGLVAANGTKKAQQAANSANAAQAAEQNKFNWNSYLLQRGINGNGAATGTIPTNGQAVNTFLPLWSQLNGAPTEEYLINQILGIGAAPDPNAWLSLENATAALAANPQMREMLVAHLAQDGDTRSPEQWLYDDLAAGDTNSEFVGALKGVHQAKIDDFAKSGQIPAEYVALQGKAVGAVNDLYDGRYLEQEYGALGPILAARLKAAEDIYGATETGARQVYDADLVSADTYGQASMQALNRALAQQQANRARQGFVGTGSGSDLTRARLTADSYQQAAGVRAKAGQDLAGRLSNAGVGRATTVGAANEQDALQRLGLLTNDVSRRLGSVNLPAQLYQNQTSMKALAENSKYTGIDALLQRLNNFSTKAAPASFATANTQPVINSGQIAGGVISNLGSIVGDYMSNKALMTQLNKISNPGAGAATTYADFLAANPTSSAALGGGG